MSALRLDVLSRQLTAGLATEAAEASSMGFDTQAMAKFMCHDNMEMRQAIWQFMANVSLLACMCPPKAPVALC